MYKEDKPNEAMAAYINALVSHQEFVKNMEINRQVLAKMIADSAHDRFLPVSSLLEVAYLGTRKVERRLARLVQQTYSKVRQYICHAYTALHRGR